MANKAFHIVGKFIEQGLQRGTQAALIAQEVKSMLEGRFAVCVVLEASHEVFHRVHTPVKGPSGLGPDFRKAVKRRRAQRHARHRTRCASAPRVGEATIWGGV